MTTIRERTAEYPVAQGITRADVMAASDRRALLTAGDALFDFVRCRFADGFRCDEQDADWALCPKCAALARWREVTGER